MAKKKPRKKPPVSRQERKQEAERARKALNRLYREKNPTWFLPIHEELETRHRDILAAKGIFISHETETGVNRIDARKLVETTSGPDADQNLVSTLNENVKRDLRCVPYYETTENPSIRAERETNGIRHLTPCFRTGIILLSDTVGIHFDVLDVDETSIHLRLQKFTKIRIEHDITVPNAIVDITLVVHDDGTDVKITRHVDAAESKTTPELYAIIPASEITDDPVRQLIWKEQARAAAKHVLGNTPRDVFLHTVVDEYMFVIVRTNYFLNHETVSRPQRTAPAPPTDDERTVEHVLDPTTPDERKVRYVGPIRVISEKPPRPVTRKTITTYRTASWQVRGHVRHYKSGKTVYVQPHVKSRREMRADGAVPAPIDLKIRVPTDQTRPATVDHRHETKGD